MPWQEAKATLSEDRKLSFAVLLNDGAVSPHPPVKRALDTVVQTLEKQGHKVIDWNPPSHKRGLDILLAAWTYDNGADTRAAFELSGEPPAPQLGQTYGKDQKPDPPKDAVHIAENNIAKREYQKEYLEYWNSTAEQTGTGKPVDAVIMPV